MKIKYLIILYLLVLLSICMDTKYYGARFSIKKNQFA